MARRTLRTRTFAITNIAVLAAAWVGCSTGDEWNRLPLTGGVGTRSGEPSPAGAPDVNDGSDAPPSETELEGELDHDVAVPDLFAPTGSDAEQGFASFGSGQPTVTYFLNRNGGTYRAGPDNAPAGVSSVLTFYGRQSVTLPGVSYSDAQWNQLVTCLRGKFAQYNVNFITERPAGGAYSEAVITAAAATSIGMGSQYAGVAPAGACRVVPLAVAYTFTSLCNQPGYGGLQCVCDMTAHEIGHSLSLAHKPLPNDLMSYAAAGASRGFQDAASACGVSAQRPETCGCGGATENSHQQLLRIVGASGAAGTGGATGGTGGSGGGTGAPSAPSGDQPTSTSLRLTLESPEANANLGGNANIQVSVRAQGQAPQGVYLYWQFTNRSLACDNSIQGVTCTQQGDLYTWTIYAGVGSRSFYAWARDAEGKGASTQARTVQLSAEGGSIPPSATSPTSTVLTPQAPVDRSTIARGAPITFRAAAPAGVTLVSSRLTWHYNGGSMDYTLTRNSAGQYEASTTVSASASAASGWRTLVFHGADAQGNRYTSAPTYVQIQ
jgi:hypothetical protein